MRTILILLSAAFIFTSCRSSDLIRPGDSLEVAFDKSMNQFENENWSDAARAFETVVSIGRGTDIGQEAQYYLAESYYNARRYLIAASEYERYAQFYPRSPRREEVDFKTAISYYNLSPRYKLDQTYTKQALERFRLFNSRYPNSERVTDSGEYITELRNKMARKNFSAGEFYMRTSRYNAAAVYFDLVIDEYPDSKWAERALVNQIEAYILYADNSVRARQKERYEKALDSYGTYLQLFPRGENRSKAEELHDRALNEIDSIARRDGSVAQSDR